MVLVDKRPLPTHYVLSKLSETVLDPISTITLSKDDCTVYCTTERFNYLVKEFKREWKKKEENGTNLK